MKFAEGYTFELTDTLHEAFRLCSVDSSRPKPIRAAVCLAVPIMTERERHYSEHQKEILRGWDTLFQRLLTSSIFADVGQDQGAQEMALGLAHDHTAQSAVDTWRESYECVQRILNPFIEAKRSSLAYHRPPSAVTGPVYQVLASDSTLAMVSGGKKTRVCVMTWNEHSMTIDAGARYNFTTRCTGAPSCGRSSSAPSFAQEPSAKMCPMLEST